MQSKAFLEGSPNITCNTESEMSTQLVDDSNQPGIERSSAMVLLTNSTGSGGGLATARPLRLLILFFLAFLVTKVKFSPVSFIS